MFSGDLLALVSIIVVLFYLAALACAVRELVYGRSSQGTIAWLLSLTFFPYLTVFAYLAFGWRRLDDYVRLRRPADREVNDLPEPKQFQRLRETCRDDAASDAWPVHVAAAPLPFMAGNEVEILINGEQAFASMWEGIEAARSHILVQFYLLRDDRIGNDLAQRLIAKAREGVKVLVLYDDIGSSGLPRAYLRRLEAEGIRVSGFNRSRPMLRAFRPFRINFRNHRKVLVIDGERAWVGGHNVGDEYLARTDDYDHWRDTHVALVGPAAQACQLAFAEDWNWATGEFIDVDWKAPEQRDDGEPVLVMPSGPADPVETCPVVFTEAISRARKRLWIVSPYFVPGEDLQTALNAAVMRGVDVRVLLPEDPDHVVVGLASTAFSRDLAHRGVKVYSYRKGFLHQKVMLVDEDIVSIGTVNFDNRSMVINFEITLWMTAPRTLATAQAMLEKDFGDARLLNDCDEFMHPGVLRDLPGRMARLFAPLL